MKFINGLNEKIEQYEGYPVFHISVESSEKPIKMMRLEDVKPFIKVVNLLEGRPDVLKKLKELEKQLTLIRDDFSGYSYFVERNIRQTKQIKEELDSLENDAYISGMNEQMRGVLRRLRMRLGLEWLKK